MFDNRVINSITAASDDEQAKSNHNQQQQLLSKPTTRDGYFTDTRNSHLKEVFFLKHTTTSVHDSDNKPVLRSSSKNLKSFKVEDNSEKNGVNTRDKSGKSSLFKEVFRTERWLNNQQLSWTTDKSVSSEHQNGYNKLKDQSHLSDNSLLSYIVNRKVSHSGDKSLKNNDKSEQQPRYQIQKNPLVFYFEANISYLHSDFRSKMSPRWSSHTPTFLVKQGDLTSESTLQKTTKLSDDPLVSFFISKTTDVSYPLNFDNENLDGQNIEVVKVSIADGEVLAIKDKLRELESKESQIADDSYEQQRLLRKKLTDVIQMIKAYKDDLTNDVSYKATEQVREVKAE